MKLRIVNVSKFVTSVSVLVIFIGVCLFFIATPSLSHTEISYKTIYITEGDTLWSIAKRESKVNPYYENKDVRYIIQDLKEINQLKNSMLSVGSSLKIPKS